MTLSKNDKEYRDNSNARIKSRLLIALVSGLIANWFWLFIIIGTFTLGEFMTMYKVLSHSYYSGKKLKVPSEEKGRLLGLSMVSALVAGITTLVISVTIKLLRDFAISLF